MFPFLMRQIYKIHELLFGSKVQGEGSVKNGRKFYLANALLFTLCVMIVGSLFTAKSFSDAVLIAIVSAMPVIYSVYCYGNVAAKKVLASAGINPTETPSNPPTSGVGSDGVDPS